jgi:hypothetical protein
VAIGLPLAALAMGALAVKAVHGGQTVQDQQSGAAAANARLDFAYYQCIDIQAHSVLSPGRPVLIAVPSFGDYFTLLKAVGSWVTLAGHPSASAVDLYLDDKSGPGTSLGTIVVAKETQPDGRRTTLLGSGASVPGKGPPPAPPL